MSSYITDNTTYESGGTQAVVATLQLLTDGQLLIRKRPIILIHISLIDCGITIIGQIIAWAYGYECRTIFSNSQ